MILENGVVVNPEDVGYYSGKIEFMSGVTRFVMSMYFLFIYTDNNILTFSHQSFHVRISPTAMVENLLFYAAHVDLRFQLHCSGRAKLSLQWS